MILRVSFAESLRGAEQYTVLMIGPPPVLDDEQNKRIEDLSFAFSREVPYIDLFSALCADGAYRREVSKNDGSHPRSEGYSKMAHIINSSPNWWFCAPNNTIRKWKLHLVIGVAILLRVENRFLFELQKPAKWRRQREGFWAVSVALSRKARPLRMPCAERHLKRSVARSPVLDRLVRPR